MYSFSVDVGSCYSLFSFLCWSLFVLVRCILPYSCYSVCHLVVLCCLVGIFSCVVCYDLSWGVLWPFLCDVCYDLSCVMCVMIFPVWCVLWPFLGVLWSFLWCIVISFPVWCVMIFPSFLLFHSSSAISIWILVLHLLGLSSEYYLNMLSKTTC